MYIISFMTGLYADFGSPLFTTLFNKDVD